MFSKYCSMIRVDYGDDLYLDVLNDACLDLKFLDNCEIINALQPQCSLCSIILLLLGIVGQNGPQPQK